MSDAMLKTTDLPEDDGTAPNDTMTYWMERALALAAVSIVASAAARRVIAKRLDALLVGAPVPTEGAQERDPIVMAADAAKAACILRIQRAIDATKRLYAMPLTAEECITILDHMTWDEGLPVAAGPQLALHPTDPPGAQE